MNVSDSVCGKWSAVLSLAFAVLNRTIITDLELKCSLFTMIPIKQQTKEKKAVVYPLCDAHARVCVCISPCNCEPCLLTSLSLTLPCWPSGKGVHLEKWQIWV